MPTKRELYEKIMEQHNLIDRAIKVVCERVADAQEDLNDSVSLLRMAVEDYEVEHGEIIDGGAHWSGQARALLARLDEQQDSPNG